MSGPISCGSSSPPFSCIVAEFIVGLSAMHAGWFPAFATALIFLVLGMLMGFPPVALAVLVGFVASGGPAFADAGYDLKGGPLPPRRRATGPSRWTGGASRSSPASSAWRWRWIMVVLFNDVYFTQDLFPPVDRVFAATIKAGVGSRPWSRICSSGRYRRRRAGLGGPDRQMGILLATGLLILNPLAGWAVLVGIAFGSWP